MITYELMERLFSGFYLQRWNDKYRPIEFTEMDKYAHKMAILYFLAKEEEKNGTKIDWLTLIQIGIFDFLEAVTITDLKRPLYLEILKNPKFKKNLIDYILKENKDFYAQLSFKDDFEKEWRTYLENKKYPPKQIEIRLNDGARLLASKHEFDLLYEFHPNGLEMEDRKNDYEKELNINTLIGIEKYKKDTVKQTGYYKLFKLLGELRFQFRWSNMYRYPKTSVLGHSFYVAMSTYFFARDYHVCNAGIVETFFAGLFHDLPEIFTRDVISPVKYNIEGLEDFLKDEEDKAMQKYFYKYISDLSLRENIKNLTYDEFKDYVIINKKLEKLNQTEFFEYNTANSKLRLGTLVRAMDKLGAYMEIKEAIKNGIKTDRFYQIAQEQKEYFLSNKNKVIDIPWYQWYCLVDKT